MNAAEEETIYINCAASGLPEPQIKWIHNGKPISESPPNPRRTVTPNMITIEKLQKKDTGNYGCNATNSLGYVYKDVFVNVLGKYEITYYYCMSLGYAILKKCNLIFLKVGMS